jgi:hypothetical protein
MHIKQTLKHTEGDLCDLFFENTLTYYTMVLITMVKRLTVDVYQTNAET